ncbi:MAG: membrane protein insertase YidC [Desulfobacterales bacterium]|nr:membrane protein insertase YidC [Desulfobacterales bacterium]
MEQVRLIIAIALSFLVFFIWDAFFVEKKPIEQAPQQQAETGPADTLAETTAAVSTVPSNTPAPAAEAEAEVAPTPVARDPRSIIVSTDKFEARLNERGAAITSFRLKDYQDSIGENSAMLELIPGIIRGGTARINFKDTRLGDLQTALFSAGNAPDNVSVSSENQSIAFSWTGKSGIEIIKTYTFQPGKYLIDLDVAIINRTSGMIEEKLAVELAGAAPQKTSYAFEGPSAYINDELEQIKIKSIEKQNTYTGNIEWIALQDRYFITSLLTDVKDDASLVLGASKEILRSQYVHPVFKIEPGQQVTLKHQLYFGPKQLDLLNAVGKGLGNLINFGFFDILAKPCLQFMNMIYSVVPNYGLAIILITIIIKIILWPLGSKSYKSMSEMKRVQPLIAEIREKYKDDKKKQNEEIMGLYRTYKINPMGGCLPMVVQIPVFFALYRMLYEAIELRHAPFIGWINDLSAPDRLFNFGFSVPFMEPPYGIPVLTLIMGATMFLQQKMSPPMGDATQAKMMMLMPIVFTFIFINFSSGLVLYWLVNNVLSISQQYYIQKKFA